MAITRKIKVGDVAEIPVGKTKSFRYGVMNGIAFNDNGTIKAFVNACTHMGGTVQLSGSVFRCCRHFAEFSPSTGERLSGQAPEGTRLTPIDVTIENEEIFATLELKDEFA